MGDVGIGKTEERLVDTMGEPKSCDLPMCPKCARTIIVVIAISRLGAGRRHVMTRQSRLMKPSSSRAIVGQVVLEDAVSQDLVEAARNTVEAMFQEAAIYGLTTAEMAKAVFQPAFGKRRGCDCPTCDARRAARASDTRFGATINTQSSLASN